MLGSRDERVSGTERADGIHQHFRGADLASYPVDELGRRGGVGGIGHLATDMVGQFTQRTLIPVDSHHGTAASGEGRRRRATKRTTRTAYDRHVSVHDVNRPRSDVTASP